MNSLNVLEHAFEQMRESYITRKGRRDQLLEQKQALERRLQEIDLESIKKSKTAHLLQIVGEHARQQVKQQIELMVTNALQFVFKEDIQFKIHYEIKRGRPEAKFFISSLYDDNTVIETDPKDARGGGVVDVVSNTLRIALAECFGIEGPIILDEPAKHLSAEYIPNFADFLRQVAIQFNRQFIIVTHNSILAECGDIQYLVTKKKGISQVTLLKSDV